MALRNRRSRPSWRAITAARQSCWFLPVWLPQVTFFFFFQAEDGIRDFHVTGVQTCASDLAVGLAYSSILFNNRALAAEVGVLEGRSDQLEDELESWVLRAAPEARNVDEL